MTIRAEEAQITSVRWPSRADEARTDDPLLKLAQAQLAAYFDGELQEFDLALRLGPSDFQADFQRLLMAIPFGETRTYGELAKEMGVPPQAIGQACGANKIPLIVPCHRVVGSDGLGGFSGGGGVEGKAELLRHEGALLI